MRGLLVTGTDTHVGKTFVAAGLAALLRERGFRVGVLKPVETGWAGPGPWPPDAGLLAAAAGLCERIAPEEVAPYVYPEPLAPLVAARRAGRPVAPARLDAAWARLRDRDRVLVEGAGGLAVPLTPDLDYAGLARRWGLPLLVVARPGLGTLNATLLTLHYARAHGLRVLGVVFCGASPAPDAAEATNPGVVAEQGGVPVLGRVPRVHRVRGLADVITAVRAGLDLQGLLARWGPKGATETRAGS